MHSEIFLQELHRTGIALFYVDINYVQYMGARNGKDSAKQQRNPAGSGACILGGAGLHWRNCYECMILAAAGAAMR